MTSCVCIVTLPRKTSRDYDNTYKDNDGDEVTSRDYDNNYKDNDDDEVTHRDYDNNY